MRIRVLAFTVAVAVAAPTLATESAADRLFVTGALQDLDPGATLTFVQTRTVPEEADLAAIPDGDLAIEIGAEGLAMVSFDQPDRRVTLPPHPLSSAHPALLVFLETVRGALSDLSGGSPHYIKNRMVESFDNPAETGTTTVSFAGAEVPAERLVFRPFATDPNADRMGQVAELELRFVITDDVPGGLYALEAEAGDYRESFRMGVAE